MLIDRRYLPMSGDVSHRETQTDRQADAQTARQRETLRRARWGSIDSQYCLSSVEDLAPREPTTTDRQQQQQQPTTDEKKKSAVMGGEWDGGTEGQWDERTKAMRKGGME